MNSFPRKTSLVSDEDLKNQVYSDLNEIEVNGNSENMQLKLQELAKVCLNAGNWDLSWEIIQKISDENARNLMIAQLIEEHLIPAHEYAKAKEYCKFLTPNHEITSLILIRLAIAENDLDLALQYVDQLPTPQSRNYAFCHIIEVYLRNNDKQRAIEVGKMMVENARAAADPELRCFLLRDVAKNFFLANGEKDIAREVIGYINDEQLRKRLLMNAECC